MSKQYNKLPSELLYIEDEYTAYCFNQVCAEIMHKLEQGQKPHFEGEKRKENPGLNLLLE